MYIYKHLYFLIVNDAGKDLQSPGLQADQLLHQVPHLALVHQYPHYLRGEFWIDAAVW